MKLSLFDLHCDTAHRMLTEHQPLTKNSFAISLENAEKFEHYTQIMALWPSHGQDDEASWKQVLSMLENLKNDPALLQGKARLFTDVAESTAPTLLLSVEDARGLAGKLERIDQLWQLGVRFLTPLWKGITCIGGSHDTQDGLTDFGKAAMQRAAAIGMILDVSHASDRSAHEIFEICAAVSRPVIASHSNAFDVCPVSRNLKQEQIKQILNTGGLIGLNLHAPFLKQDGTVHASDLFPHIEYFLAMGAEDSLALGCDMDGCDLPYDLPNLVTLPHLAEQMLRLGYPEKTIQKIFFENATKFTKKHLQLQCQ